MQPDYSGPGQFQASPSLPINSTPAGNQDSVPLAPLALPPPIQVPPDIYQARNNLRANNSTCLVGILISHHGVLT